MVSDSGGDRCFRTEKVEKQVDTCNIVLSVLRVVVAVLGYTACYGGWLIE